MSSDYFYNDCIQYMAAVGNGNFGFSNTANHNNSNPLDGSIFTIASQSGTNWSFGTVSNGIQSAYDSVLDNYRAQIANLNKNTSTTGTSTGNYDYDDEDNENATSTNSSKGTGVIDSNLANKLDSKLGSGFSTRLEEVAANINCDPNDLLAMMYSESGLNPQATNAGSNATGLIQFIPSTLSGLGYTTSQIKSMTPVQQLDVVEKFYQNNKSTFGFSANDKLDAGTLYALCFLPACSKNEVLCNNSGTYTWAYNANIGLDLNKDGSITKSDLAKRLDNKYKELRSVYA